MDIFGKKRIKKLEDRIWQLKRDIEQREEEHKENADLKLKLHQAETEIATLKDKIRIQTEADLYFECEKIKNKLIKGKKKEELQPQITRMNELQAQLAQQQQPISSPFRQLGQMLGRGLF